MKKLIQWWLTPKFPEAQIKNVLAYKPNGFYQKVRNFYRTWIVHPLKRRIARYYLIILQKFFGLTVIGITGSAGKTTTAKMLTAILKLEGKTISTLTNIDPIYNIPTTILKCSPDTKYLVLEMGVEYPDEMDFYLWLARPSIGIVTNVYPTHVLFLGSVEKVAKEKMKLIKALSKNSYSILNSEDKRLETIASKIDSKIIWFGAGGEVQAQKVGYTTDLNTKFILNTSLGNQVVQLPILGIQFVQNSLAAASAALVLKINLAKIKKGLENFERPEHRMVPIRLRNGALLVDDVYNNNPEAAKKSIEVLVSLDKKKRKILVFGEMKELGEFSPSFHKEIGRFIGRHKVDLLITYGEATKVTLLGAKEAGMAVDKTIFVKNKTNLIKTIKANLRQNDIVLIKGSRSLALESVVEALK